MLLIVMCIFVNKQIRVNESKTDIYVDRMQQSLISDKMKNDFENLIFSQAVRYGKFYQNDS